MNKPNRAQILDDTRGNYSEIIAEGHKENVIKDLVVDMYRRVDNVLKDGRVKAVAIYTLQDINKRIDERQTNGKPDGYNMSKG